MFIWCLGARPNTLTTNVETINVTTPYAQVNGILGTGQTINSFDVVNGYAQAGVNTTKFNIVDTNAADFAMPGNVTLSGLGAVTLNRTGAGNATGSVTVTNTTFGTGVTAFTLSNSGNLTGGASTVDVTLNSASSVSVSNSAATKYTTVAVTDTSTTAASTGSTLTAVSITGSSGAATLTGNAINTVNLNGAATAGTVTVTAAAGTRALTVNVAGTTNSGSVTDAQATTATLNQTAAATMGTLTVAKATTVNVNTTGAATTAGAETITSAAMTALNVGGTRANTVTLTNTPLLATVTVTGTGGATLGNLSALTSLTLVDTSAATNVASATGAANLTVANSVTLGVNTAFTGGAGSDSVTVGATAKTINLGTGVNVATLSDGTTGLGTGGSIVGDGNDTIAFATAANAITISGNNTLSTAFKTAVTGFSTLELAALASNTTATLDVTKLSATAITQLNLAGDNANAAASHLTISNLGDNATIQVTGAVKAGSDFTTAGTTGSGVNDVLNLSLKSGNAGAVSFGTFVTPNVENIKFVMADTQATPVGYYNTATLTNAAARSITVSGNSGLDLGTVTGATALTSFDASGVTLGGVKVTADALQFASTVLGSTVGGDTLNFSAALAATNITTYAGTNTVLGSKTVASTFTGGSGADTYFGGTGADTINAGAGAEVVYGNNAGVKQVNTITYATNNATAGATFTVTIGGTAVVYTDAAGNKTPTEIAAAVRDLINADATLSKLTVATSAAGVLTLTDIVDGVITNTGATTSAATTVTVGNPGVTGGTTAGTSTTTGSDVITAGAGSDTLVFGISSAAPSTTALQTVTDFNAGNVADFLFYAPTVAQLATANATATNGVAAISANGIATFVSADQGSLAAELTAVAAGINANGTAQGKSVAFQYGADAYVFISDASNGVTAGDVLVKLTGVNTTSTAFDQLVASGHTLTLA